MESYEVEQRVARAQELFKQGFNCSQSVFAACADLYGIKDESLALRLGASFGGGIGRMRQTCGAACGMFLLEGLQSGSAVAGDIQGKGANYQRVQALAEAFKNEHGSITCSELLGLTSPPQQPSPTDSASYQPSPRTKNYYKKRPCVEIVASAVRIFLQSL